MTKTMLAFIPKKPEPEPTYLIQGQVPESVAKQARAILDAEGLTWKEFLTAACKQLVEQEKGRRK